MPPEASHLRGLERMYAAAPTNQMYTNLALNVGDGSAAIEVDLTPDLHHIAGAMHGSHYFKLLDDAAFFASNSLVPDVFVLTAQFSVQLMRPVSEGRLRAEGWVSKPGRQLFYADSVLMDSEGREIGRGHGVFSRSKALLTDIPEYRLHQGSHQTHRLV